MTCENHNFKLIKTQRAKSREQILSQITKIDQSTPPIEHPEPPWSIVLVRRRRFQLFGYSGKLVDWTPSLWTEDASHLIKCMWKKFSFDKIVCCQIKLHVWRFESIMMLVLKIR